MVPGDDFKHMLVLTEGDDTLFEQDLARELGLSGPQSTLVLGGANIDVFVDSFQL